MKELQFTLYEILGYLLPGAVLAGGLAIVFWAVFLPQTAVDFDLKSVEVWGTFLVVAYVLGHIAQGIGNAVTAQFDSAEELAIGTPTPAGAGPHPEPIAGTLEPGIVAACRKKATELTGADASAMPAKSLYLLCDDAVVRSGKIGQRDVYVYREGFYRGTCIGLAFLVAGLVLLAIRLLGVTPAKPHPALLTLPAFWLASFGLLAAWLAHVLRRRGMKLWGGASACLVFLLFSLLGVEVMTGGNWETSVKLGALEFTPGRLVFLSVIGGYGIHILWQRYRRFGGYRVTHAMLGFLTIRERDSTGGEAEPGENNAADLN